jgi:aspartate 1-decarboxylase
MVEKGETVQVTMLKGKIHRARVTGADLNYEGSIEIDSALMESAGILPFEHVDIWNITNGERFATYALSASRNSGTVGLNGAAARKVQIGDEIIITAYASMTEKQAKHWKPHLVFVDERNRLKVGGPLAHGLSKRESMNLVHDA